MNKILTTAALVVALAGFSRAAEPNAEGFVSLFNGKDLSGWQGAVNGYKVDAEKAFSIATQIRR